LFGDGFRSLNTDGTPFNWQGGSTARFGITVDGSLAASPAFGGPNSGGAWVTLLLFQHDTLSPTGVRGPTKPHHVLPIPDRQSEPSSDVLRRWRRSQSDADAHRYLGALGGGPISIVQDFQPGGDFDWVLLLGPMNADLPGRALTSTYPIR
jgi:hypothetical protein